MCCVLWNWRAVVGIPVLGRTLCGWTLHRGVSALVMCVCCSLPGHQSLAAATSQQFPGGLHCWVCEVGVHAEHASVKSLFIINSFYLVRLDIH